jgi:hypothetical protein
VGPHSERAAAAQYDEHGARVQRHDRDRAALLNIGGAHLYYRCWPLYFEEASEMQSVPAFALGTAITINGLVVLAREKGRQEQLDKPQAESESTHAFLAAER